jgi:hypothetical protein
MMALGWWYLKAKIVQDCKKPKVEMYKPIWDLVSSVMTAENNLIQFNSHKNITIKEMREKKIIDQTRTQDVTEFGLKMPTSPGLPTSNNWGWVKILKNSFTLVELGPLHKNGLPNLSITRVTTHLKRVSTTAQEKWALQLKKGYKESRSRRIKLGEYRETRLILNKDLVNWVFLSLGLSLSLCILLMRSLKEWFS